MHYASKVRSWRVTKGLNKLRWQGLLALPRQFGDGEQGSKGQLLYRILRETFPALDEANQL